MLLFKILNSFHPMFLLFSTFAQSAMFMLSGYNPQEEVLVEVDVASDIGSSLVLFNDEVNSFDFVIESLVEVCGHDPIQAEQCTIIVHFKGKCAVKDGSYEKLEPMCTALLERGLTAEVQTV
jgi:ATP-dependent Clp protease adaptor protein ClpS